MGNLIDLEKFKKQREEELQEYQKLSDEYYLVAYELLIYELGTQVLPLMQLLDWEMIALNENGDLSYAFKKDPEV